MIKKRRIQFSLRSLLLLMTLSAIGIVVFQVATGPSLNKRMLNAIREDRPLAFRFYLWLGADPNNGIRAESGYGWSPLQNAVYDGNSAYAVRLIAAGANVNYCEKDGFTAIVYAADKGDWDTVKMLYEAGADHRMTGADGARVVDYAIVAGRRDIIDLLTNETYPPDFWTVETINSSLQEDNDGLPYNRWIQVYRSDHANPAKWPLASGFRKFNAMVEIDADGNERTVRGAVSVKILEDQNWVQVSYADGSIKRVPI